MNQEKITNIAYREAIKTLEKCSSKHGFYASGGKDGYDSVWGRDSSIGVLGASLLNSKKLSHQSEITLATLAKHRSKRGQIPNCVDLFSKRKKQVTFATLDSSLWFLIALKFYSKQKKKSISKYKKTIEEVFNWIDYQDAGEEMLPEQQPTSDWEDCFPHKYGHVLNSQALYYGALKIHGQIKKANEIKKIVNGKKRKDMAFFDNKKGYYLPWIWKDHDGIREQEEWFDSLANLLTIIFGLADKKEKGKILAFIEKKKINSPFPVKVIYPPIKRNSKEWKPYFSKCLASNENIYINGGIWPYVGGFYVVALVANGEMKKAEKELEKLAEANKLGIKNEWEFNEWINPITKKASGSDYHTWSAAAYILAYESVKKRKSIL